LEANTHKKNSTKRKESTVNMRKTKKKGKYENKKFKVKVKIWAEVKYEILEASRPR